MAQNKDRTYPDDGLYFDFIDNLTADIDFTQVALAYGQDHTYPVERVCIASDQDVAMGAGTATLAVAYAGMLATDIVLCQAKTAATAAYIMTQTINASTGFTVVWNTAPGTGTFDYQIFRLVSALT